MKRRGRYRLWTEAEDRWLRLEWGRTDIATLGSWLQRTVGAIAERGRKLKLRRNTLTLRAFARLHRVPISRVYWALAQRRLIRLKHVLRVDVRQKNKFGRHYALTPKQQESLMPLLRDRPRQLSLTGGKTLRGVWGIGIKPPCCNECASTSKPHYAKGYCKPCYVKVYQWQRRRHNNPSRRPQSGSAPRSLMLPTKKE